MIKIENIKVYNIARAVYSSRNAMNSWDKSDSDLEHDILGENDLDLAKRLYKAGTEHRKYLRQIFVSMDITAPLYWWKEADTYKVGTVANSCSTMHKIHAKEFTLDDFSHENLLYEWKSHLMNTIGALNLAREFYLKTKDKKYWWQMIQLLPSSYNQRRTITMNYENVMSIINQREGHKLDEWREMVATLRTLPYVKEIRGEE
ncbi:MAG: hypothetical protein IKE94_15930 [Aeriscardovia sp.]|nr:hypothetical protein [Aeriscardovia sp.]